MASARGRAAHPCTGSTRGLALALSAVLMSAVAAGCSGRSGVVPVSPSACGSDWSLGADGRVDASVRNVGNAVLRVDLLDAANADVFASVASLTPGSSWQVRIALPDGSYRLVCAGEPGTTPVQSPAQRVTSSKVARGHPLRLLTESEAQTIAMVFSMRLVLQAASLTQDTANLQAAVRRSDLSAARSLWLVAHTRFESMGGMYGVFGSNGIKIDGLPNGLPGGVQDPGFTGFHRLEYLLWNRGSPAQLQQATSDLVRDVNALQTQVQNGNIQATDVIRSCHRILESTLRFPLTGADDFGSHSQLATVATHVGAAQQVLQTLRPALQARNPDLLSKAAGGFTALAPRLQALQRPDGTYPPLQSLSPQQQQQVVAAVGQQVETLALIPTTLQLRTIRDAD